MLVEGSIRKGVVGQVQYRVPQRAGPQQGGPILVLDLPVEPTQRRLIAGVGQWLFESNPPVRGVAQVTEDQAQGVVQLGLQPTLRMTLKQRGQAKAGGHQRHGDRQGRGQQQAKTQGTSGHQRRLLRLTNANKRRWRLGRRGNRDGTCAPKVLRLRFMASIPVL